MLRIQEKFFVPELQPKPYWNARIGDKLGRPQDVTISGYHDLGSVCGKCLCGKPIRYQFDCHNETTEQSGPLGRVCIETVYQLKRLSRDEELDQQLEYMMMIQPWSKFWRSLKKQRRRGFSLSHKQKRCIVNAIKKAVAGDTQKRCARAPVRQAHQSS